MFASSLSVVQRPLASVGVDLDGDGVIDMVLKGADADGDGIPDVLQARRGGGGMRLAEEGETGVRCVLNVGCMEF